MAREIPAHPYTLVVTSCGRFDLLIRTLTSFFKGVDEQPARAILIEDSADSSVRAAVSAFPVETIVNQTRLGQMASIDKAYALVETPLIFHCEDDWEFTRSGFLAQSRTLLGALPDVSMIGLRARESLNPLLRNLPEVDAHGQRYFLTNPAAHPEYFSYSFNPGLRRTADARAIGPFAALGHEADVSLAFKRAGFRMAYLAAPAIVHIGDDRHVDDPKGPRRPRNMFERLARSVGKRTKRLQRAFTRGGND